TPWGTIFTAEENVQYFYGDLEDWWSSRQVFNPAGGAKAGGIIRASIAASPASEFGMDPNRNQHKDRDAYGYLVEIDVGLDGRVAYATKTGRGHRKLGAMGRVRWENMCVRTGADGKLVAGEPVVLYGANDRRGGRIYKFVSSKPYAAGMDRASIRRLLDEGAVFVAHFADLDNASGYFRRDGKDMLDPDGTAPVRGRGRWIRMSLDSTDVAPNAGRSNANNETVTLVPAGTTVGAALRDTQHNGMGGFASQSDLLKMLWTAANKIGVRELNRPEDVEWNPKGYGDHGPMLVIAFTKHGRPNALDANGVLNTNTRTGKLVDRTVRDDPLGSIFALQETGPGAFSFWALHRGSNADVPAVN
ncbi:MAG: alkaline phosphatase PhoX, partial [Planctomycetota bacterium]